MANDSSVIIVLVIVTLLIGGCVTINNGVVPTPTITSQNNVTSISTTPTVNEALWTPVIDSTYVLTATCELNEEIIPILPNTAYRLSLNGEKRLAIDITYDKLVGRCDSQGNYIPAGGIRETIANGITNYNGIFKTNSYQKYLHIEWLYLANVANEPNVIGSSQNVKVKLERYNGDSTIFPDTTNVNYGEVPGRV